MKYITINSTNELEPTTSKELLAYNNIAHECVWNQNSPHIY